MDSPWQNLQTLRGLLIWHPPHLMESTMGSRLALALGKSLQTFSVPQVSQNKLQRSSWVTKIYSYLEPHKVSQSTTCNSRDSTVFCGDLSAARDINISEILHCMNTHSREKGLLWPSAHISGIRPLGISHYEEPFTAHTVSDISIHTATQPRNFRLIPVQVYTSICDVCRDKLDPALDSNSRGNFDIDIPHLERERSSNFRVQCMSGAPWVDVSQTLTSPLQRLKAINEKMKALEHRIRLARTNLDASLDQATRKTKFHQRLPDKKKNVAIEAKPLSAPLYRGLSTASVFLKHPRAESGIFWFFPITASKSFDDVYGNREGQASEKNAEAKAGLDKTSSKEARASTSRTSYARGTLKRDHLECSPCALEQIKALIEKMKALEQRAHHAKIRLSSRQWASTGGRY